MRRPILMAAAAAVAAIPIVLMSRQESLRTSQPMKEQLRTFDAAEAPAPLSLPKMETATQPPPLARPAAPPPADYVPADGSGAAPSSLLPETAPRVAYSYGYRFRVPNEALAPLQERHLQLCQSLGSVRCRVVSMRRSESRPEAGVRRDHGYGGGGEAPVEPAASLELQVAAEIADELGRRLTASTGEARGELADRQISGDDVSRAMVDSEARIRSREALIRRLSALLETRSGNIEQAVEAERSINQAQEELDAARTWLAETRGRVAMSRIAIAYEPLGAAAATRGDPNPIATALQRVGSLTVQSLAALLLVAGVVVPWALLGLLIVFAARWHRRRTDAAEAAQSLPAE
ncbi:MAG TPA: DUF4349 domain-containing protein [Allosphingosinicella sp.]|jgi:hypothetical protein